MASANEFSGGERTLVDRGGGGKACRILWFTTCNVCLIDPGDGDGGGGMFLFGGGGGGFH